MQIKQRRKNKLPRHAKKVMRPYLATELKKCVHSIAQTEEVRDQNGKMITMRYALPCQVTHKATTKNPTHKTSTKVTWK